MLTSARVIICDFPGAETGRRIRDRNEFAERQIQLWEGLCNRWKPKRYGSSSLRRGRETHGSFAAPSGRVLQGHAHERAPFFFPEPTFDSEWRAFVVWGFFASHKSVKPNEDPGLWTSIPRWFQCLGNWEIAPF